MSSQDLQKLVEEIVQRVLQRIENDADLSRLLRGRGADFDNTVNAAKTESRSFASAAVSTQNSQKKLYTERDILEFAGKGGKALVASEKAIFTPSALDAARAKGITIRKANELHDID